MNRTIRVLVVDDSAVVRGLLTKTLASEPLIEVTATAMHGEAALHKLRQQAADVVILDVEMPVMDGLTALPLILREFPSTRVVMVSSLTSDGADATIRALALGAAGCIAKPTGNSVSESIDRLSRELVPLVKALAPQAPAERAMPSPTAPAATMASNGRPRRKSGPRTPPAVVVIGTSTGGPQALSHILKGLGTDLTLPILIVQHMPAMFTPMLARHLARDGRRPCTEAAQGAPIERGRTYVAPGDFHLRVVRRENRMLMEIDQAPPEHFCRPSVNPLFHSAAECYGSGVLAVMLTGMGDDGIEGTRAIAERNGYIVAQDQASSVVWGMPAAVVREQLAHEVLPLDAIASAILRLCAEEVLHR